MKASLVGNKFSRLRSERWTEKRKRRQTERGEGTKWTAAARWKKKKREKSPNKRRTFTLKENKESCYMIWREETERAAFNKENIGEVAMRAMWPARRSLHPTRRGVTKAARLHVRLMFGPDPGVGLNRTGCSSPACRAPITPEPSVQCSTVDKKKKRESVEQACSCFIVPQRCCCCCCCNIYYFI